MFVKLTRSGGRRYLQLVESYRNDAGQPRQRTVATVGRLDEAGGAVDTLIDRLLAATGRSAGAPATALPPSGDDIRFDASLAYGDAFVLDALWRELGFDAIGPLLRSAPPSSTPTPPKSLICLARRRAGPAPRSAPARAAR